MSTIAIWSSGRPSNKRVAKIKFIQVTQQIFKPGFQNNCVSVILTLREDAGVGRNFATEAAGVVSPDAAKWTQAT